MHQFDYHAPQSLSAALAHLSQHAGQARPLAGGTDLLDQMRVGRLAPDVLVDIKKIPELNVLIADANGLRVGGAVPCYRIYSDPSIPGEYAALSDSCHIIGGIQIQSRASLGGNLCNSGPAADSAPAMIALRGRCIIAGPSGQREVPVESFCTGPGQNVLQPGELLVEFQFPSVAPCSGSHYRRMIPRNEMDIAVVGVGASVQLDGNTIVAARLGLGAVAPTPLFAEAVSDWLKGQPAVDATYVQAASLAQEIVAPITDMRGTREYRVHATGVLVQRVLALAVARAQGKPLEFRIGH